MALVFAPVDHLDTRGKYKARRCTATIASYTTGGEAVSASGTHALQVGLRRIVGIDIEDAVSSTGTAWKYDDAVPEIFCRETGAAVNGVLAEVGSTENAGVVRCVVYGD